MDFTQLSNELVLSDKTIKATLIKPIRNDDVYKTGIVMGFKPGTWGGGYSHQNRNFSSLRQKWIKKPRVLVVYNCGYFMKSQHFDWVDVDNCEFEIVTENESSNKKVCSIGIIYEKCAEHPLNEHGCLTCEKYKVL